MAKKVLFFDVDGTLVNEKNEIPESALKAIAKTRELGNLVFINSGRCYGMMREIEKMIEVDGLLCGCGTEIIYEGKSLYANKLPRELREKIAHCADKYNVDVIAEGHRGCVYSIEPSESRMEAVRETAELIDILGARLHEDLTGDFDMDKFCIQVDEQSDIKGFYDEFEKDFDIIDRHDGFYECVPNGHSKGTAVEWVLKEFGISKEDAYCFGDSTNDLTMFQSGVNAVAMGVHSPELEKYACFITKNLEDDGVEYAMKHFNLC